MTPVEEVLAKIRHRYLIIGSGALRLHGIDWKKAISTFGLIPIYPMRTGKRLSMMPLVLSSDLGSEASQTEPEECVHRLASPVRHRWTLCVKLWAALLRTLRRPSITRSSRSTANVAPMNSIMHIKRSAKRLKDYRHAIKLARKLLNAW